MTYTHKLSRRLAVLRALAPHCAMLPALALAAACSAGTPTGVDTALNPADAQVVVNPRLLLLEANQVTVFRAFAKGVPGDSLVTSIEWTATGGTIALNGTYSSPSTGDFRVVGKRHGPSKTTADTATVTVVSTQPSLTAVVISPTSSSVMSGTQQMFIAAGKLSNDSTVAIGVTWTATGGSIDAGGVYTAGSTAGTYTVIAKAASANVADTVPVTVTTAPPPPPPPGGAYFSEDWSGYASTSDWASGTGPAKGWGSLTAGSDWSRFSLDGANAYPGLKWSLRYDFISGYTVGSSAWCNQPAQGRQLNLAGPQLELWYDFYVKFSSNWTTSNGGTPWASTTTCPTQYASDHKLVRSYLTNGTDYFGLKDGHFGNWDTSYPGGTTGYWDVTSSEASGPYYNDQWHHIRLHYKVASGNTGIYWFEIDGKTIVNWRNAPWAKALMGIGLIDWGANMNTYPPAAQSFWIGKIALYNTDPGWGH